ncbi:hypothetical protein M6G65_03755 [Methylobacterium tardum]|nr:hypothetical protein [Methylobacterium tardum]URD37681.1 hypothetical protein M6G65_03755 [Methylobacterium tardum]
MARHLRKQGEIAEQQRLADHRALGAADDDEDRYGDHAGQPGEPGPPGEFEPEQQDQQVAGEPQAEVARREARPGDRVADEHLQG